jgi:hypothetical protein
VSVDLLKGNLKKINYFPLEGNKRPLFDTLLRLYVDIDSRALVQRVVHRRELGKFPESGQVFWSGLDLKETMKARYSGTHLLYSSPVLAIGAAQSFRRNLM